MDDWFLFGGSCLCYGYPHSPVSLYITSLVTQILYPSLKQYFPLAALMDIRYSSLGCFVNFFSHFLFLLSLFNVSIAYRLMKNSKTSSFVFQFVQFLAISATIFLCTPLFTIFIMYIFPSDPGSLTFNFYVTYFQSVFIVWSHFLSLSLTFDRFYCMWKPLKYKVKFTKINAFKFSLYTLLISMIIPMFALIGYIIYYNYNKKDQYIYTLLMITSFGIAALNMLILSLQFILLILCMFIFKNKTKQGSGQLSNNKQINRILICITACDIVLLIFTGLTSFVSGMYCLKTCGTSYEDSRDPFVKLYKYTQFICEIVIVFVPFLSSLFCFIFSTLYRQTIVSMFKDGRECLVKIWSCIQFKSNVVHVQVLHVKPKLPDTPPH